MVPAVGETSNPHARHRCEKRVRQGQKPRPSHFGQTIPCGHRHCATYSIHALFSAKRSRNSLKVFGNGGCSIGPDLEETAVVSRGQLIFSRILLVQKQLHPKSIGKYLTLPVRNRFPNIHAITAIGRANGHTMPKLDKIIIEQTTAKNRLAAGTRKLRKSKRMMMSNTKGFWKLACVGFRIMCQTFT